MSSGTFAYPLYFTAMLVAIGLMVSPRREAPVTSPVERAAYHEIVSLYEQKNVKEARGKCESFMRLYPNSKGSEAVATILGECLVQGGNWKEAGPYFRGLAGRFPKSEEMDRFVFFQGFAYFQNGNFAEASPLFDRLIKCFPNSLCVESAIYYMAMSHFLSNGYDEALAACQEYLKRFPIGHYAGDMHYRLAFIDSKDSKEDRSDKIIRDLSGFLADHPDDAAHSSMLCLLADTYKKKKGKTDEETKANEDKAIECYIKAVWTDSPDDVIQYALDSATNMLKACKDFEAVGNLHGEVLKRKPDSQFALLSAAELAKNLARVGKATEAAEMLATAAKSGIANPAREQVEFLIDEMVKVLIPRKKVAEIDIDELDKQLVGILNKTVAGRENRTTAARIEYARARLAQMLIRKDLSDLYLKEIATSNARDPSPLSPKLLATCGDILLKSGDLNAAEAMYKRLKDHFQESMSWDAGVVGLGYVELARKKPEAALKIFDNALANIPGMGRFNAAILGKIEALFDLDQLDAAEKLARAIVGDRQFRGVSVGKAYLLLARIYRMQAARTEGEKARNLLVKAHGTYIRVFVAYKSLPDLCAEAIWEAAETAGEMGDKELRLKHLKVLLRDPKLENTGFRMKALEEINLGD